MVIKSQKLQSPPHQGGFYRQLSPHGVRQHRGRAQDEFVHHLGAEAQHLIHGPPGPQEGALHHRLVIEWKPSNYKKCIGLV